MITLAVENFLDHIYRVEGAACRCGGDLLVIHRSDGEDGLDWQISCAECNDAPDVGFPTPEACLEQVDYFTQEEDTDVRPAAKTSGQNTGR